MEAAFHLWWQKIKQHRTAIGVAVLVVVVALITVGYRFGWTGFKGKTLWDWLQLLGVLAIPVVVGFGAAWFTRAQQQSDQRLAREQHDHDQVLAEQRAKSEREATEQRAGLERELTRDNQRETLLQAYIDNMSEFLLEKGLRNSQLEEEVRTIARVRTLTVLSRLDAGRKRSVLQFLYEAKLIDKDEPIVDLSGADLSKADLSGTPLVSNLIVVSDLSKANLRTTKLRKANLRNAYLSQADLSGTDLRKCDLRDAYLGGANLRDADLDGTKLSGADLSSADLSGAKNVTDEQLGTAYSRKGMTKPDGTKCP